MSPRSPSPQPERSGVYIAPPGELPPAGSYDRKSAMPVAYDSFSPENQRRLNQEAAARSGEQIPAEFYFSDFVTARKDVYRPGFEKAIRTLLDGRIKTLYVTKVDRLTRRGMAQVGMILDELERSVAGSSSSPRGSTAPSPARGRSSPSWPSRLAPRPTPSHGASGSGTSTTADKESGTAGAPTATWSRTAGFDPTRRRRQSSGG